MQKNRYKIVIFGNSGSGKSTLAKEYAIEFGLAHLDLDTLAWQNTSPPVRSPLQDSIDKISQFIKENSSWVIEGCYSDLFAAMINKAEQAIFLNLSVASCINNCKNRPWEPGKYKSQEQQNKNLEMLLDWVKQYPYRDDEFSLKAHQKLYDDFTGQKQEYTSNERGLRFT